MVENSLWLYSRSFYPRPGVESLMLELQDKLGADVNILLCCCWLAEQGRVLAADDLAALIKLSAVWRAECILPLRAVRRFLKARSEASGIYQRVKSLELDAEQWQQDQLQQYVNCLQLQRSNLPASEQAACHMQQYFSCLPGVEPAAVAGKVNQLLAVSGLVNTS